tara:strand:+ start:101 stop:436 length:336 start_codon:yes stop_codon:yes gene_type:complete
MSITLLNVRSPKWKTIKTQRLDSDGNVVNDSDGNPILDVVNDSDGNPIMDVINDSDGNPVRVIQCECQWSHLGDNTQAWLPFSANSNDTQQHGKDLYAALVNGDHGAIAAE